LEDSLTKTGIPLVPGWNRRLALRLFATGSAGEAICTLAMVAVTAVL